MKKINKWKTTASKLVHKNPWYDIEKNDVILPNGENGEYFIIKTRDSSLIVPVKNNKIIFIKQYRYIFDDWFLELPGGSIEKDETPLQTAIKELHEEVGYVSENIKEIGTFIPCSGIVEEFSHVFVAKNLNFVGQKLESSEEGSEVIEIDIKKVYNMIENGQIVDGQTITSLILAKKYL